MIFCNGCSKTGTHILTNIALNINAPAYGGSLIKRTPKSKLFSTSNTKRPLSEVWEQKNNVHIHCHMSFTNNLSKLIREGHHKHLCIFRHPKDVAVSWLRHRNKQNPEIKLNKQNLIKLMISGMFNMSVVEYYSGFLPWLDCENTYTLKFEDFKTTPDEEIRKTLDFLQIQKTLKKETVLGNSATATKSWSLWQDWWDEDIEAVWEAIQGPELCNNLGYTNL